MGEDGCKVVVLTESDLRERPDVLTILKARAVETIDGVVDTVDLMNATFKRCTFEQVSELLEAIQSEYKPRPLAEYGFPIASPSPQLSPRRLPELTSESQPSFPTVSLVLMLLPLLFLVYWL